MPGFVSVTSVSLQSQIINTEYIDRNDISSKHMYIATSSLTSTDKIIGKICESVACERSEPIIFGVGTAAYFSKSII